MKYTYQTDGPRGPPAFYWRKNMKHILSCSFGKDSIATALLALQHGEPLDELVYCEVMFSEGISGELPEHNRFIHETAIPYFEQRGIPTRVLRSEKTYLSCFYHVVTRGKTKGMLSGFPLSGAVQFSGIASCRRSRHIRRHCPRTRCSTSASPQMNPSDWHD